MFIYRQLFISGVVVWLAGTLAVRVAGQYVFHPDNPTATLVLFAVSFPLIAGLIRRLCHRFHLPRAEWLGGAVSVMLPTLLLDPFTSAFFPVVYPNIPPQAAGVFGGWILCCCAAALVGVTSRRRVKA